MASLVEDTDNARKTDPARIRIRVWDLPIRIFHWALAVAVITAIVTGKLGGSWMNLHGKAGLTIIGLLVFRLIWGFVGSTHARFAHFAPSLSTIRSYCKGQWNKAGHNPLGALFVFSVLGLLLFQAVIGLFANDEINFTGPLYQWVDEALSLRLTGLHQLLSNFLLSLVALHLLAIGFYVWFKKDNLVKPMLTGWKEVNDGKPASRTHPIALFAAVLIALATVYVVSGEALPERHFVPVDAREPAW